MLQEEGHVFPGCEKFPEDDTAPYIGFRELGCGFQKLRILLFVERNPDLFNLHGSVFRDVDYGVGDGVQDSVQGQAAGTGIDEPCVPVMGFATPLHMGMTEKINTFFQFGQPVPESGILIPETTDIA